MNKLRIGIRQSQMSRPATENFQSQLADLHPELRVEVLGYDSAVDYSPADPEAYVIELEQSLMKGEVDVVLHLLKEIPVRLPPQIQLLGVGERGTPFDAFISDKHALLDDLPDGATIGVSHLRQKNQLLIYRFDLKPVELHGSVESRLQQMRSLKLDGLVVSAETLERVGLQDQANEIVSEEILLPSPGQGCVGFLGRRDEPKVAALLAPLMDHTSRLEAVAERAFLHRLGGNPEIALGVHAALDSHSMIVEGVLISADASCFIRDAIQGPPDMAEDLGAKLAELLLVLGHEDLQLLVSRLS